MKPEHQFSRRVLLAKMKEADQLAATIREMEAGEDRDLLLLRWAIVADEVTGLTTLAEEILSEAELSLLRASVQPRAACSMGSLSTWREACEGSDG